MLTRRALARLTVTGLAAGLASGCALLPPALRQSPAASAPADPFGDFVLTSYLGDLFHYEIRGFGDGAALHLDVTGGTAGMIRAATLDRLRTLLESVEFREDLTRELDRTESQVCQQLGEVGRRTTFRMGRLTGVFPCIISDRPALEELESLLEEIRFRRFAGPLPNGQPDLPRIVVEQLSQGRPWGKRYELRPDGTLVVQDGDQEPEEEPLQTDKLDVVRLLLRTDLRPPTPGSPASSGLRIQIGEQEPVQVPQGALYAGKDGMEYQLIGEMITSPF
ncbi:hypothetical protein [Microlunatus speluncae]|uniref:hypothetical protein n=1 Tax=Microlunatus speluncae TaxID=2594267 RepID=UPI00126685A7|nr:hypothetical protein [Microlunatus speluncae]